MTENITENNPGHTPETEVMPDVSASTFAEQLINAEARLAIEANGLAEDVLPDMAKHIGWRQTEDGIELFTQDGVGREAIHRHAAAMASGQQSATEQGVTPDNEMNDSHHDMVGLSDDLPLSDKAGSGAQNRSAEAAHGIDAGDALALGQALHAIARGEAHVRFA